MRIIFSLALISWARWHLPIEQQVRKSILSNESLNYDENDDETNTNRRVKNRYWVDVALFHKPHKQSQSRFREDNRMLTCGDNVLVRDELIQRRWTVLLHPTCPKVEQLFEDTRGWFHVWVFIKANKTHAGFCHTYQGRFVSDIALTRGQHAITCRNWGVSGEMRR